MNQTLVKICGNTTLEDAQVAVRCGADYVGAIVEYPPSPRHVSLASAREIRRNLQESAVGFVAITVNLSLDELRRLHDQVRPDVLQLHGDETPELVVALKNEGYRIWSAVHTAQRAAQMHEAGAEAILVDARVATAGGTIYGGTGQRSDWILARDLINQGVRVILAGGLDAQNVKSAIEQVRPWMLDTLSGVEARKGVKDPEKVAQFIAAAREDSAA